VFTLLHCGATVDCAIAGVVVFVYSVVANIAVAGVIHVDVVVEYVVSVSVVMTCVVGVLVCTSIRAGYVDRVVVFVCAIAVVYVVNICVFAMLLLSSLLVFGVVVAVDVDVYVAVVVVVLWFAMVVDAVFVVVV